MSVRARWLRPLLSGLVVAAAIAPQATGCAGHRSIPYSEVSLADMSNQVDVRAQITGSGDALVFSGALWRAGEASTQDDEPPPLDECPSLPRDAKATVDGRPARVERGGWVESTSGGCDHPTSHHYRCAGPIVALGALGRAGKTTIVVTQGQQSWTIAVADLPTQTSGTIRTRQPMRSGERAEVALTPLPPPATTIQATFDVYRCGTLASAEVAVTRTNGGFAFTVPTIASRADSCRDGGLRDAGADLDVRDAQTPDGDAGDGSPAAQDGEAGAAHENPKPTPADAIVVVSLGFSPRVVTCDGPRSCASPEVSDRFEQLEVDGTYAE